MSKQINESHLKNLAEMWRETAKLFEMAGTAGMKREAKIYEDCAKDLEEVISGKLKLIRKK